MVGTAEPDHCLKTFSATDISSTKTPNEKNDKPAQKDVYYWTSHELCVGGAGGVSVADFLAIIAEIDQATQSRLLLYSLSLVARPERALAMERALSAISHMAVSSLCLDHLGLEFYKSLCFTGDTQLEEPFQRIDHLQLTDDYLRPHATLACLRLLPRLRSFKLTTNGLLPVDAGPYVHTDPNAMRRLSLEKLKLCVQSLGCSPLLFMHHVTISPLPHLHHLTLSVPNDSCTGNWKWLERLGALETCRLNVRRTSPADILHALETCQQLLELILTVHAAIPPSYSFQDPQRGPTVLPKLKSLYLFSCLSSDAEVNNVIRQWRYPSLQRLVIEESLVTMPVLLDACEGGQFPALFGLQLANTLCEGFPDTNYDLDLEKLYQSLKRVYAGLTWHQSDDINYMDKIDLSEPVFVSRQSSTQCVVQ